MDLKLKKDERIKWLDAWGSIDADTSNSVDAAEFLRLSSLSPMNMRKLTTFTTPRRTIACPSRLSHHDLEIVPRVSRSLRGGGLSVLRRSSRFNKLDSTLDVRDVQRFVEHRYGFKKASAKKKSLQIFQFIGPCPA